MKFLASLLIVCIVALSSFSGSVAPSPMAEKAKCAQTDKKGSCSKPLKKAQHHKQDSGCEKQGCNMLLSCCAVGFLAVEPTVIHNSGYSFVENTVPTYKSGNSTVYLPSDWKPPKFDII